MPPPQPDRELRRFIAELAEASLEDLQAILGQLDPPTRERARELLSDFGIYPRTKPGLTADEFDRRGLPVGISPWLAERLAASFGSGHGFDVDGARTLPVADHGSRCQFAMTPETVQLLRSVAMTVGVGGTTGEAPVAPRELTWFQRLIRGRITIPGVA